MCFKLRQINEKLKKEEKKISVNKKLIYLLSQYEK